MHILTISGYGWFHTLVGTAASAKLPSAKILTAYTVEEAQRLVPSGQCHSMAAIVDVHTPLISVREEFSPAVTVADLMRKLTEADVWTAAVYEQIGDLAALGAYRGSTQHDSRNADPIVDSLLENRVRWDLMYI